LFMGDLSGFRAAQHSSETIVLARTSAAFANTSSRNKLSILRRQILLLDEAINSSHLRAVWCQDTMWKGRNEHLSLYLLQWNESANVSA
jgi:hypothetical protein